ncbi:MAG: hypothetical protein ABUJ93_08550, partial [Hyphomicrobium sp.]
GAIPAEMRLQAASAPGVFMEKRCDGGRVCGHVCRSGQMRFTAPHRFAPDNLLLHLFETYLGVWITRGNDRRATEQGGMIEASMRSVRRNLRGQDNVAR